MSQRKFSILYESDRCIVVCKPPGILTQAPPGVENLVDEVKKYLGQGKPIEEVYLGIPHRLDRPVSGVICFGKTRGATRSIVRQFERRRVKKIYWACVEGRVEPAEGLWYDFVRKVPDEPRAEICSGEQRDAQLAVLQYRVRKYFDWGTWLEIELQTGRMHQVRIQAASRGHPVIGDEMYGSRLPFGPQYEDERLRAIALHARLLQFREPSTSEELTIIAPLHEAWHELGIREDDAACETCG